MRGLPIALCALLAYLAVVDTASAEEPVAAGHLALSIASNAQFPDYTSSGQRLEYVVLQDWQANRMRALKTVNPNLKVLVYKNLLASQTPAPDGFSATGVTYEEANAAHPGWFLQNRDSQRFTLRNYPYQWAMDIGESGYQQRWGENVVADVKAQGWDGVFIDNVDPTIKYYADVSSVTKYPTDEAYAAATKSALATITPRLHAAHMLVFANFGSWSDYDTTVTPWLKYVDGAMEEMFAKFAATVGDGYRDEAEWTRQLGELKETQRQGKTFLAITHSAPTDEAAALYGWASVLLGAEGKVGYELAENYADETWFPEYEYPIGQPLGPESRDADGVHRRVFANGLVLVNPTASSQTVEFEGNYSGSGLAHATSTTMDPHTGLVLLGKSLGGPAANISVDGSAESTASTDLDIPPGNIIPGTSKRPITIRSRVDRRLRSETPRSPSCARVTRTHGLRRSVARPDRDRPADARCEQQTQRRRQRRAHGAQRSLAYHDTPSESSRPAHRRQKPRAASS
jgi:Hypothetical glycosyl hydrolase family 15